MPDMRERRQFARYPVQLPVVHEATSPGFTGSRAGWTRDLSEGGACLELDERLPIPRLLRIHLQTDRGAIEVEAQVVWEVESRESGEGKGGILHGVAFTHLSQDQLQALRGLLFSIEHERRAGIRLPLDLPVTCQPKDPTAGPLQGRTGDVSRGGLLLRLSQVLAPGTALQLTLDHPNGRVTAEGEIVWAESPERRTAGEPIRHGLRFNALGWSTSLSLALLMTESARSSSHH
ncbi:MAG: PilZ domain-containing protein [Candidatus Methylomirabilota bacterium]|jgi:c-di-GMP-binding flagellar brake protein YcgR